MHHVYLVDGLEYGKDFDFNIVELISDQDIKIKRQYKRAGILGRYTPVVISTNSPPGILYPNNLESLSERMLFVNCEGCELFRFIDRVRRVHGLPRFNEQIVQRTPQMF